MSTTSNLSDVTDRLKREIAEYGLEKLPKEVEANEEKTKKPSRRSSRSYWKDAYGLAGLKLYNADEIPVSEYDYDKYWNKV